MISIVSSNASLRHRPRTGAGGLALILALAALPASVAGAATFLVDNQSPAASPSGPGTEAQPYSTITSAVTARKGPGVTIVVRPGVYREMVTIPASGAEGAPYVIRAEGPGVVLEGSDDFTGMGMWVEAGPVTVPGAHDPKVIDYAWLAPGVTWSPAHVFVNGQLLTPSDALPILLPSGAFTWVDGEGLYVNVGGPNPGGYESLVGRRPSAFRIAGKSWVTIEGFEIRRADDTAINIYPGCTDILVARNRITLSQGYGIKCATSTRVVIEGNSVSEGHYHGIGLTAGATGCMVRDNECFRNAKPGVRMAKGIYLQGAPDNTIVANRTYENQDTGVQINGGSHNCLLYNNRSWNNGDHGYDHLDAIGTTHVHNVAYANYKDGFSIEGDSPGTRIYNSISVENGLTTGRFNLWVNAASATGFTSGYNIIWNSSAQAPVKFITTRYHNLDEYIADSGQDTHSMQEDPWFADPRQGDFTPLPGSPAIDAGNSGVPNWPATDYASSPRFDDPSTPDIGDGPVTFADIGAIEYVPPANQDVIEEPLLLLRAAKRRAAVLGSQGTGPADLPALSMGFPNPSRGPVEFALDLPRDSRVEWAVFDLQGRAVWSEGRTARAGRTQLRWDGTVAGGVKAPTGVYMVRASADGMQFARRVVHF